MKGSTSFSYARTLLYEIADKVGRQRKQMDSFAKAFQDNWYDTKDAIRSMKTADFEKINIPARIITMIMEAVGTNPNHAEKMDIQSPIEDHLYNLKKNCQQSAFNEIGENLCKIFGNIRQHLSQEKYRTLKKSNPKIAKLIQKKEVVKILQYGGFQQKNPGFVMTKINIGLIDECLDSIARFAPKQKFNPYEQHTTSRGDTTAKSYEGESSIIFNEKLADLEKERERMMSRPIKDREIKIFQIDTQGKSKMDIEFNEQKEYNNEDERIYIQNMKEILKRQSEDPKFMNRRKQEYYELAKQPCYSETIVRVKLPDDVVFQCKFSPLETLQALVYFFEENLVNRNMDYYLYMTPPVQKVSGLLLRKTFYELGCVPRAIFYFKTEEKIKGTHILKSKKSGFNFF